MTDQTDNEIAIIYDDQCPICSHYVKGLRLTKAGGKLRLQSARQDTPEITALKKAGYDLNQGMVVKVGEKIYYGADSVHILSLMSSPVGIFNRCLFLLFQSPKLGRLTYPLFRNLRLLLLKVLGKQPIDN